MSYNLSNGAPAVDFTSPPKVSNRPRMRPIGSYNFVTCVTQGWGTAGTFGVRKSTWMAQVTTELDKKIQGM